MARTRNRSPAGKGSLREYRKKRDFSRTTEPAGGRGRAARGDGPRFVVQKHDASQLHFDLRLEMDGVMRSWAVPRGPSLDPAERRLAVEVEDHPIEYNDFEGTIPEDEYGGGTVMIWDRGTYVPNDLTTGESREEAAVRAYRDGELSVTFEGERLRGAFTLVRTDEVKGGRRSKWLLIKRTDEFAKPGSKITGSAMRSVTTGRTMKEIAAGKGGARQWHSNRSKPGASKRAGARTATAKLPSFQPMLATAGKPVPASEDWVYEAKYDGVRILAFVTPNEVALMTRNGLDRAPQFPEVVAALRNLQDQVGEPFVVDGELLPLVKGKIGRFEHLKGRIHLTDTALVERLAEEEPAALVLFDCLLRGRKTFLEHTWTERRKELESLVSGHESTTIRISEKGDDRDALLKRGRREGWEGIIAKLRASRYRPGVRTPDWRKLKIENRQEFVVGGWTEPRRSRPFLGALLLGYYRDGDLIYAGHTGTGFSNAALADMHARLKALERKTSPFRDPPATNEKAHWVSPKLVVEVKFNEWTREGRLRQSAFVGIRDDKEAKDVIREPSAAPEVVLAESAATGAETAGGAGRKGRGSAGAIRHESPDENPVAARLRALTEAGGEGELDLGAGVKLQVTSLTKVFYPKTGHTKGDLLTYYARMADHILPWMEDRPLVLKRYPNGVDGESFYQQAAPDSVPPGVRVGKVKLDDSVQRRLVGGNLATLLYTVQLGAISFDPWHSRVAALKSADYSILDLDPGPGANFRRVVQVARWVGEEMEELGLRGGVKTSGSSGIHIYLPVVPRTPLEAATLVARIIATRVAEKHPKEATVQRMTKKRPRGTVYVDYLQNILGKSVAGVYAARAKQTPTVSTPLRWDELTPDLDMREFTIDTVPDRVAEIGDVWGRDMKKPNRLGDIVKE